MSLRNERNENKKAIIEGRFIRHVLQKEAKELDNDIHKRVSGFNSEFWKSRNFSVNENTLTYKHARGYRFVDMKTRGTSRGKNGKMFHNVHNRILYGHANEIIKELVVGLTGAVREQMEQMDGQQI